MLRTRCVRFRSQCYAEIGNFAARTNVHDQHLAAKLFLEHMGLLFFEI